MNRRIVSILSAAGLAGLAASALGQDRADTAPDAVSRALRGVVSITANGSLIGTESGNGFFIGESGVIATDLNLIEGAESVSIRDFFGDVAYFPRIVGYDRESGIVLLRFPEIHLEGLPLGDSEGLANGDAVFIVDGSAAGYAVEHALISRIAAGDDGAPLIELDRAVRQSFAGSPLLTDNGTVVGIAKRRLTERRRTGAIPIDAIHALLEDRRDISIETLNDELGLSELISALNPPEPPEKFSLEARNDAWAKRMENGIFGTLAAPPGLAFIGLQAECRETVCRAQLVAESSENFRDAHGRLRALGVELRVAQVTDQAGLRSVDYYLFPPADDAFGVYPSQLVEAVEKQENDIALFLIETGADLNQRFYLGWTPLSRAAQYGNLPLVRALLAAGADPGIGDDDGRTPLDYATKRVELYATGGNDLAALGSNPDERLAEFRTIIGLLQDGR